MQVLVDATAWISYFTGRASAAADLLDKLLGQEAVCVADLTVAEVLCGIPDEHHRKQAAEALGKFWLVEIHGFDHAEQCAVNYHSLRARGIEVSPVECHLASWCIQNAFALLHDSPGYDPFEKHLGLKVVREAAREGP